jgi:hypothetical protein
VDWRFTGESKARVDPFEKEVLRIAVEIEVGHMGAVG